jgi:hypothetical protein
MRLPNSLVGLVTSGFTYKYLVAGLQAAVRFHDPDPQKPKPGLLQIAARPHISKQHTSNSCACKLIREIQPLAVRSSHGVIKIRFAQNTE